MDRALAESNARDILGEIASRGTAADWTAALDAAVTPDLAGRWPTAVDWVPTYDPYWTAAEVVDALALRALTVANVTKWTSEGTSVETQAVDYVTLAAKLRAKSSIPVSPTNVVALGISQDNGSGYDTRSGSWPDSNGPSIVGNWS